MPRKKAKKSDVSRIADLGHRVQSLTSEVRKLQRWKDLTEERIEGIQKAILLFEIASTGLNRMGKIINERMEVLIGNLSKTFPGLETIDADVLKNVMSEMNQGVDTVVKEHKKEEKVNGD